MYFNCTPGAWEVGNQRTQGLSALLNNTSGSPTAKSLHSQGIPEIICQTSLSNLMHFSYFFKDTEKKWGKASAQYLIKHFPSSWMKNANSGQQKEWEWGHCWLAASPPLLPPISNTWNVFGKCDPASVEGCNVRLPAQVLEQGHRAHQLPLPKSWSLFQKRRKKSHKEQEKRRTQKHILAPGKFQIDLTHTMPQEFEVFLCAAVPQWITKRVGGSKLRDNSQWDSHSL